MTTGLHPSPTKLRINIFSFVQRQPFSVSTWIARAPATLHANTSLGPECSSPKSHLSSLTGHSDTVNVTLGSLLFLSQKGRQTHCQPGGNVAARTSGGGKRLMLLVLVLCWGVSHDCWVKRSRSGDFGRPHWCLFMWSARWSEREKQRPQWWHLKGLAPVCFLKWRVSSSDRANLHSQPSHEHRYGFSPVGGEEGLLEDIRAK